MGFFGSGFSDHVTTMAPGSVTVPALPGKRALVTRVHGWFSGTGPQTGVLRLKQGSTVIWEAAVSGGHQFEWPGYLEIPAGYSITLELSGGMVAIFGGFEE